MNAATRAKIQKWIIEKSVKDTGLPVMPVSETTTDKIVSPIPAVNIAPVCAQEAVEKAAGSKVCSNCGAPWIKSEPSCSCNYAYPGCTVPKDDPAYMPYPSVPGTVLDCFGGSGTTGEVAREEGRNAILCELNPEYVKLAEKRSGI